MTSTALVFALAAGFAAAENIASSRPASAATAVSRLDSGVGIRSGASLDSANHNYVLRMQTDGNLVFSTCGHGLWSSNTAGHPGAFVVMQTAGNLVVYTADGATALWSSPTAGHAGAYLAIQDAGNLVIYPAGGGSYLWASSFGTGYTPLCAGTTLTSGQAVGSPNGAYQVYMASTGDFGLRNANTFAVVWDSKTSQPGSRAVLQATDGHLVVYSSSNQPLWAAPTAGGAGAYLAVTDSGNLVEYSAAGATVWQAIGLRPVPQPSWWKGVNCSYLDASGKPHANGNALGSFLGLVSCGPGSTGRYTQFSSTPVSVQEWQCVELTDRWLWQEFGLPQQVANGNRVAPVYWSYIKAKAPKTPLTYETPTTPGASVTPGDVMSYDDGLYGHTAVVTKVTATSYTILSENWSHGNGSQLTPLAVKNGVPQGFSGYHVVGWLHYTG
jgi:hypothetical protein